MADPVQDGTEPVVDDELLYRRIPVSMGWYDMNGLSPDAFRPRKDETTGISVTRAKYSSIQDAARGKSKKGYYVAVVRAGDVRNAGGDVIPRPERDNIGHAEIPELNCHALSEPLTQSLMGRLTDLTLRVEGPFVLT